jgi:DnaJ-class molecular chaperone
MGWRSNTEDKAAMRRAGSKNTRDQRAERRVTCRTCNGAGQVDGMVTDYDKWKSRPGRVTCRTCNGVGQVTA